MMFPPHHLRLCVLVVINLAAFSLQAQNADIHVRTFHAGDSVMIRWIPSSYSLWQQGNSSGYKITRFGMDEYLDLAGQDLAGKGIVIAENVKPLSKNDTMWNHLAKTISASAFVYSSIYSPGKPNSDQKKREQQENLSYGFSLKACDDHPEVAKAAGLFFTDRTANKGEQYIYRIELLKEIPGKSRAAGIGAADEKQSVLFAVENPAGQFRNKSMRLTFDVSKTREQYSGYIIERSDDSINFSRVNKDLLSFVRSQYETEKHELVYEDSISQNGKLYWYRIRGYSYFGIEGPPSSTVRGKGKEEWNAYPVPDTCYSPGNKRVIISWSIPTLSDPSKLKGVIVLRNDKVMGLYSPLTPLPVSGTTFTDTTARFTNYYMLAAISTDNDTAFSFPILAQLQDNDPPAIPKKLAGIIDTNGVVQLSWDVVTSPDLKGYRVFRCNSLKEEFVEVSDSVIRANSFTDTITLQTLSRGVYYSVRSVDHVWNNSDFSAPAKLRRPDKVAPVAPLVKSIYHTDSSIVIGWINSSSDDIASKKLLRKSPTGSEVIKTYTSKDTISMFIDTTAEPGTLYAYELIVADSSGNASVLRFPTVNFSPRVRPALKGFTGEANLEKRTITLKWELPTSPADRIIIYKGKEGEPVRTFKTLSGTATSYIDNQLYPGNAYVYRVKVIMKDGSESTLSEVRIVF